MPRPLESIGIGDAAEQTYLALLRLPGAGAGELAEATGLDAGELQEALAALERHGLVTRAARGERSFIAAAPDLGLGALIRHEHERLEAARRYAGELDEEFRHRITRKCPADLIEVVRGREAVAIWYEQLQRSATHEVLQFDTPPYAVAVEERPVIQLERLGDGIRYRTVYDAAALQVPGQREWLARTSAAGERARAVSRLPMKLVIVDGRVALLPLSTAGRPPGGAAGRHPVVHLAGVDGAPPRIDTALLVYASVLLEALRIVFEGSWEQGVQIAGWDADDASAPGEQDLQILALIAAGLKDEAVAYRLGLSPRTLRRRVAALMRMLGADNRFQAGYQTARRRWLEPEP